VDGPQRQFKTVSVRPARPLTSRTKHPLRSGDGANLESPENMATSNSPTMSLVRKRDESQLMPPPPLPKRIKRPKQVIDEDLYTEALSKIIARDFFPGLLENETQQEYLDALESKDQSWISNAGRRLQQVMTPSRKEATGTHLPRAAQTPRGYVGDTPLSTVSAVAVARPEIDINMSLAAFQAKYTSEDNESFYKLLDKQNQKRVEKYAWLWTGNKLPSRMQLKQKEVEAKLVETRSLDDDGFKKDRLAIKDKDNRPAAPETWKSAPKNGLMFRPNGIEDDMETVAQRAQAESRAAPKSIVYENTRMPDPNFSVAQAVSVPPSPSLSAVRDAIAGRTRSAYQDSDAKGDETPRVNGYAFVDDESSDEEIVPAPIIKLGSGDSTPNPFQIRQQSKREDLHRRMVDRIAESKRASARNGMTGRVDTTPARKYPSTPRTSGGLTPAAQRLWTNMSGPNVSSSRTPFDKRATPKAMKTLGLKQTPR
jgi:protein DGCR14